MLLATAATYLRSSPVTAHSPLPFGSHTTPSAGSRAVLRRGAHAVHAVVLVEADAEVEREVVVQRRLSSRIAECVRKFVPWLLRPIGSYSRSVRFAPGSAAEDRPSCRGRSSSCR